MHLILYSKPGCHLCEGLQEKLQEITSLNFDLEVRDITTREDWWMAYQYEIPVLCLCESLDTENEQRLPRVSPRLTVQKLEQMLRQYLSN